MKPVRFQFFVAVAVALLAVASPQLQAAERSHPRVATSGDGYLVIWNENDAIYGVRLNGAGHRLDSPRVIATGRDADVVWSGDRYVVGYRPSPTKVATVNVDAAGRASAPSVVIANARDCGAVELAAGRAALMISVGSGYAILSQMPTISAEYLSPGCAMFAVAAADSTFTISSAQNGVIGWTTYNDEGAKLQDCCAYFDHVIRPEISALTLASNGTDYLQLWTRANEVGLFSSTLRPGVEIVAIVFLDRYLGPPRAAWDGAQYVATVTSGDKLHVLRYDAAAFPAGSPVAVEATRRGSTVDITASNDGRGAVVWIRENGDVRAGLFDVASLAAGTPFRLMTDVNRTTRRRAVR